VNQRPTSCIIGCGLLAIALFAGCNRAPVQAGPPPQQTPEVLVSTPVIREVTDYEDFPGRTEPVSSIEVRARVTGYLEKVLFKEGSDIKAGDPLFEIDPRPYEAAMNQAEASVVQARARWERLEGDYLRAVKLLPKGVITQEEYDRVAGDRAEADAAVVVAKAARELAALNLSFTKVTAPIDGRISRRFIDPGNMVKADETILTTIIALNPVYAYFDLDERTTMRIQRMVREGTIPWSEEQGLPVWLGLPDEEGYPYEGMINFADNRVDAETGTWRLRAVFENDDLVLAPGLIIRLRVPIGQPHQAILVSEQALGADQGQKYVYVVDDKGQVSYRRVQVGRLHDGLRAITDGLSSGERVVVGGLQRVRPGGQVQPKMVEMPIVGMPGGNGPSTAAAAPAPSTLGSTKTPPAGNGSPANK
jgi:RND family efflux transporter MFP subunit